MQKKHESIRNMFKGGRMKKRLYSDSYDNIQSPKANRKFLGCYLSSFKGIQTY